MQTVDNEMYACTIMPEKGIKICIFGVGSPQYTVMFRVACDSIFVRLSCLAYFHHLLQLKAIEHEAIETP
jgi:hypothetical protein